MKKLGKLIALLLTAAIAVTMFALPVSAAGISSAKTFAEGAVLNWSAPAKKSDVCYLKMTFSDSGKVKFSIGSQKTTAKSKYQILDSKGNKKYSGKISALAGKEITVNKGTYYLKLTLQKGQYVKKLKYTFAGKTSAKKTTGDWLTGYTLTNSDIEQLENAFRGYIWHKDMILEEGKITEQDAITWLILTDGAISNPYNFNYERKTGKDPLGKYWGEQMTMVPEKVIDDTLYHLFNIKASHTVDGVVWCYYKGYYYIYQAGAGNHSYLEYISNEKTKDGRFIAKFVFHDFVTISNNGDISYNNSNIYALISVHKTDGKNYIRLHGVYKNKPSL